MDWRGGTRGRHKPGSPNSSGAPGPRVRKLVTTRGAMPVVVISADDYVALVERRPPSFRDLLLPGDGFEPERATLAAEDEPFSL